MTKDDVFNILDVNAARGKTSAKIFFAVSLLIVAGGVLICVLKESNLAAGAVVGGIGLLFSVITGVMLLTNSMAKQVERVKNILGSNPEHLVWSYVFQQNNRGMITISVIMNFKDGKTYSIDQNVIPGKDTAGFMNALAQFNPGMHIGYSEEIEYKFKKRTL